MYTNINSVSIMVWDIQDLTMSSCFLRKRTLWEEEADRDKRLWEVIRALVISLRVFFLFFGSWQNGGEIWLGSKSMYYQIWAGFLFPSELLRWTYKFGTGILRVFSLWRYNFGSGHFEEKEREKETTIRTLTNGSEKKIRRCCTE